MSLSTTTPLSLVPFGRNGVEPFGLATRLRAVTMFHRPVAFLVGPESFSFYIQNLQLKEELA